MATRGRFVVKKTKSWINELFMDIITTLVDKGYLYIIENKASGCYQLAFRKGKKPNTATDAVWELDVEEFTGDE